MDNRGGKLPVDERQFNKAVGEYHRGGGLRRLRSSQYWEDIANHVSRNRRRQSHIQNWCHAAGRGRHQYRV
jgi:hypothetical protein